jgi:hypothetical protein
VAGIEPPHYRHIPNESRVPTEVSSNCLDEVGLAPEVQDQNGHLVLFAQGEGGHIHDAQVTFHHLAVAQGWEAHRIINFERVPHYTRPSTLVALMTISA